jgi:hypothetical protein
VGDEQTVGFDVRLTRLRLYFQNVSSVTKITRTMIRFSELTERQFRILRDVEGADNLADRSIGAVDLGGIFR